MTDVVERVRALLGDTNEEQDTINKAADEIERLREALRKIACGEKDCNCMSLFSTTYDDRCVFGIARSALGGDD